MKYVDEFRDPEAARRLAERIGAITTRPHTLMEICGGQTHAILRFGIDELLPPEVSLIHGPGCPVCVTPTILIDKAIALARRPGVIMCSFGDMLRVPGSETSLYGAKAEGADVRIVYSPLDALQLAQKMPDREVVFFAVGFETTAPANALAVYQAHQLGVENFSILCSHVLVPPAIEAIMQAPECRIQGFLAAGHVCTVMGYHQYEPLASRYGVPFVVTGFEPLDLLEGVYRCVKQLEEGRAEVENAYGRCVEREGNPSAQELLETVFEVCDRPWRGLGPIPASGLALRPPYDRYNAEARFSVETPEGGDDPECMAGQVLQGLVKPSECPAFGVRCTPTSPLGAPMVSGEGACAAYYRYRGQATAGAPAEKA